jgi:acyl dehydratase
MTGRQLDTLNLWFDEFRLGDRFSTGERTIEERDVLEFARLTGDLNPLHMDEAFARTTRFGRPIVNGILTLAITGGLRHPLSGDRLVALYGLDRLRVPRPTLIGDTLRVEGEVVRLTPRDAGGVVTFEEEVLNQRDERVALFERSALYRRRPG